MEESRPSFIVIVSFAGNSSSAESFVKLKACAFVVRGKTVIASFGICSGACGDESARSRFFRTVTLVKDTSTIKVISNVTKIAIPTTMLVNRISSFTIEPFCSLRTSVLGKAVLLVISLSAVVTERLWVVSTSVALLDMIVVALGCVTSRVGEPVPVITLPIDRTVVFALVIALAVVDLIFALDGTIVAAFPVVPLSEVLLVMGLKLLARLFLGIVVPLVNMTLFPVVFLREVELIMGLELLLALVGVL